MLLIQVCFFQISRNTTDWLWSVELLLYLYDFFRQSPDCCEAMLVFFCWIYLDLIASLRHRSYVYYWQLVSYYSNCQNHYKRPGIGNWQYLMQDRHPFNGLLLSTTQKSGISWSNRWWVCNGISWSISELFALCCRQVTTPTRRDVIYTSRI